MISEKPVKRVLFVDDIPGWHEDLSACFHATAQRDECPYRFTVDVFERLHEAVEKIRDRRRHGQDYHVIVFDQSFPEEGLHEPNPLGVEKGLFPFALAHETGRPLPVIIIFTAHAEYRYCVTAMRYGAWDYITKDPDELTKRTAVQVVVDSAVNRLRELDTRERLDREIGLDWVPNHSAWLRETFAGKIVALWPAQEREDVVVARGADAFELAQDLNNNWRQRRNYEPWMQPYLLRIPPLDDPW